MSVVIVDIHKNRLNKSGLFDVNQETTDNLRSLYDYLDVAKKVIGRFSSPSVAKMMLNDEDAIAFVANHLMNGTLRWKPDGGRTLYSYLNQCGIWAIKRWMLNKKVSNKYKEVSLDSAIDDDGNTMYKFVANKDSTMLDDGFEDLINKDFLNPTQKECLRMKFVEGMTYRAIGSKLNKSGSRIEQIVTTALSKLRKEYNDLPV